MGVAKYAQVSEAVSGDELVTQYAPLLKRIAYHLISRLPPSVQIEDLMQAGMIGLLEASKKYDPSQGASFETYAGIRIRGAMMDEIRRSDWTPRSVHRKTRQLASVVREIENREGREARDEEIVEALGIGMAEYHRMLQDATTSRVLSMEDMFSPGEERDDSVFGESDGPLEELYRDAFKEALAENIDGLPEREKLVLSLYYDDELNLREIGEVLGVSESRVCQIHGQALVRLRSRMTEWTAAD
jgi:RNA polymerase sigma factor for flagellar operon FliA